MRTLQINLYSFNELTDDAKEKAIQAKREENAPYYWDSVSEFIEALKDIAYAINGEIKDYEFSTCSPSYIEFYFSDIADELKDLRALKYIYHRFVAPFMCGKYYGKLIPINDGYIHKKRYSKAIFEFEPKSGICIDYVILTTYKEYIEKARNKESFDVNDFIKDIEKNLAAYIVNSAEEYDSDQEWMEKLQEDDSEIYTKEGQIY